MNKNEVENLLKESREVLSKQLEPDAKQMDNQAVLAAVRENLLQAVHEIELPDYNSSLAQLSIDGGLLPPGDAVDKLLLTRIK